MENTNPRTTAPVSIAFRQFMNKNKFMNKKSLWNKYYNKLSQNVWRQSSASIGYHKEVFDEQGNNPHIKAVAQCLVARSPPNRRGEGEGGGKTQQPKSRLAMESWIITMQWVTWKPLSLRNISDLARPRCAPWPWESAPKCGFTNSPCLLALAQHGCIHLLYHLSLESHFQYPHCIYARRDRE